MVCDKPSADSAMNKSSRRSSSMCWPVGEKSQLNVDGIRSLLNVSRFSRSSCNPGNAAADRHGPGRPRSRPASKTLVAELPAKAWKTVTYRDQDGKPIRSRFAFVRVTAARPVGLRASRRARRG